MSWEAALLDSLMEAEERGAQAFRKGEIMKSAPDSEKYRNDSWAGWSANIYHGHWVTGWERARDAAK